MICDLQIREDHGKKAAGLIPKAAPKKKQKTKKQKKTVG
jgi:hypothetical protein